jgi:hypothetical protein
MSTDKLVSELLPDDEITVRGYDVKVISVELIKPSLANGEGYMYDDHRGSGEPFYRVSYMHRDGQPSYVDFTDLFTMVYVYRPAVV